MPSEGRVAELAEELFRIGALKLGDFTLSSGRRSGYYLDLRLVPSHPNVYRMVIDAYREMVDEVGTDSFDAIAGVATSGLTLSSPLAFVLRKPMVYVRREEKGHGMRRLLEGDVPRGSKVVLVDDLATTGGSLVEAVQTLEEGQLVVTDALVLVDRLEGAKSRLADHRVKLRSFATVDEIVDSLRKRGSVSEDEVSVIRGRSVESPSIGGKTR